MKSEEGGSSCNGDAFEPSMLVPQCLAGLGAWGVGNAIENPCESGYAAHVPCAKGMFQFRGLLGLGEPPTGIQDQTILA